VSSKAKAGRPAAPQHHLTHVPVIARIPGGTAGNVSHELIELFDIMPTCLELAGTKATQMQMNNLFGDSSLRAVQAELQTRLVNWYIDTSGVPPLDRQLDEKVWQAPDNSQRGKRKPPSPTHKS
jgi:arylsulfatase A-like enzyme